MLLAHRRSVVATSNRATAAWQGRAAGASERPEFLLDQLLIDEVTRQPHNLSDEHHQHCAFTVTRPVAGSIR